MNYILFGPGEKDASVILKHNPNTAWNILHIDRTSVIELKDNMILISNYIYHIPKNLIFNSKIIYFPRKFNYACNLSVVREFFSKYNYIKTFIGG